MNPFERPGLWLRCGLHAHTSESDGGARPGRALAQHYDRAGFDVLAITDHHLRTLEPSRDGLLTIPGAELDAAVRDDGTLAHILAFGVGADPWPRRSAVTHRASEALDSAGRASHGSRFGRPPPALVLNGGVSLAVWMSGVVQEFDALRCAAFVPEPAPDPRSVPTRPSRPQAPRHART